MYRKNLFITLLALSFLFIASSSTTYINTNDENLIITYDNMPIKEKSNHSH